MLYVGTLGATLFYSLLLKRCLGARVLAPILSSEKKIKDVRVVKHQSVKLLDNE